MDDKRGEIVIERVVQFGTNATLTGVFTEPAQVNARANVPPVILINSGILHKVGACRLYVKLARALARAGVSSLRFDLSGLGDSDVRRDALSFEESAVAETRDAMDYLTKLRGWTEFQLAGLCSGADVAHMTAVVDPRVVSMASIDARTHETPGFWWHNYAPKLLRPRVIANWFKVRAERMYVGSSNAASLDASEFEVPTYVRTTPPKKQLGAELAIIASRGVRLLYIFTDGLDNYNHEGQHRQAFKDVPFGSSMIECHLRGADHIVTDLGLQEKVVQLHLQWALTGALQPQSALLHVATRPV